MNQPAPEWQGAAPMAPAAPAPQPPMMPAPPAPALPEGPVAAEQLAGFAPPVGAAAMLDVAAPLQAMPMAEPAPAVEPEVDPSGQWWSPGVALVLAGAAVTLQLVAFYAGVQLPLVEQSGTPLSNFDTVIGSLPLVDGAAGKALGGLLAAAALGILLYGSRRGLREPALQAGVAGVAALSLLLMFALPSIAG